MDDYRKYFDPQTLAKLTGLELKARLIVEGYVAGLHKSPYSGFSVEFAEHREYAPGDDVRYVDWKVFGKTDRFYLKRFEEETNFACHLLLDASESMSYRSQGAAVSKLEYAQYVAAALAHLVIRQQDAVGLAAFNTSVTKFLGPSSQPAHLKQLVHVMEHTRAVGETALGPILHDLAERIRKRGLVIILSDLFDDVGSLLSGLKHFRHRRHDVSVMQVIDPAEQDFPFEDPTRFRGLEGLPEQNAEPRALRRAYQAEFESFLRQVRGMCGDLQIDYVLLRTDRPLDIALRSFLTRRIQRAGERDLSAALLTAGPLAFGFANPWLLWGLALGTIPILIHLLHRRTYRETSWAAMRFLIDASRKNSRRMRLEQLILLAVRTLLLLFAVLAFAEPLMQAVTAHNRARTPMQRVIVIDASFSMGAKSDAETRFDRAKKAAQQIVSDSLAGDAFNLLRIATHSGPAVVHEPAFEPSAVLSEIDHLPLTDEPGDLRPTLAEAAQVLVDPHAPAVKEVIFISDFQRLTWAADSAGQTSVHDALQKLAERARIVLVDVGDGHTDNAAITSLATGDPITLPDRPTRLRAGIRNFGSANLAGVRVELYVDGYLAAFKNADVPAREEAVIEFPYEFHAAGEHMAEVRLPPDRLVADNQRWLSVPVAPRMNILVVNGHEGGRPAENASYYVQTVLAPATSRESWSGATHPRVISESDLASEDLSQYDCIFLCNVALFTPTEATLLRSYAEAGGGIVFALGDRVKPENYNSLLYRDGQGVLPAALGNTQGDARDPSPSQKGFTFDAGALNHPIVEPFRGNPNAGLDRAVTLEYYQVKLAPRSPSRAVLRFDSGDPAIVERPVGLGRSLLLTTSADVTWSTWPVHPTFPPIIHELIRFAVSGRSQERQRLVGEPLARLLATRELASSVVLKTPDGVDHALRPIQTERTAQVVFPDTTLRGVYEMIAHPASSSSSKPPPPAARMPSGRRELFAVNVDTRESDLEALDEKALHSTTFAGIPYLHRSEWTAGPRDLSDRAADRSGLSAWLLAAVVALLLVEPLLAWSFRYGFVLLCTLVVCGLLVPWIPRNLWGGAIIAAVLAGGVVAILRFGPERRAK